MGILGSEKSHLSAERFNKARQVWSTQGVKREHRDELESILAGKLDERTGKLERTNEEGEAHKFTGTTREDIEKKFQWMKENSDEHNIPHDKIDALKAKLDKHL